MLRWTEIFFVLQVGDKSDAFSVDRLKPVVSAVPVTPAVPPLRGRPRLVQALFPRPLDPGCPLVKKVSFSQIPATKLPRNPHRTI